MAAPNIINSTSVIGKRSYANLTTTMSNVITNGATSGNLIKVSELSISNNLGTNQQTNVQVGRGSSLFNVAGNVTVPSFSVLTVVSRDSAFYMEEGDYLQANASASAGGVHLLVSYEVTS
jgi:hypothetical protein